jgi:hypothetical protein
LTSCSLVRGYVCFGSAYCLHLEPNLGEKYELKISWREHGTKEIKIKIKDSKKRKEIMGKRSEDGK